MAVDAAFLQTQRFCSAHYVDKKSFGRRHASNRVFVPGPLSHKLAPIQAAPGSIITESAAILLPQILPWLRSNDMENTTKEEMDAASLPETPSNSTPSGDERPILSIAGGGRYFFWYLGVVKYIQENFDLSKLSIYGASAGALIAVLAVSGVNLDNAVRAAYRLSEENEIWTRPGGLMGIWGSLIRQWLDELLPMDAHVRCRGRVRVVVTEAPSLRLRYLEDFASREDLIDAAMASVHIPFFLDGSPTCTYKGQRYLDGSLWDFISGRNSELLTCNGNAFVVDYFNDEQLQYGRLDFIKLSSYDEVKDLMRAGYAYAARCDGQSGFEASLGPARKGLLTKVVEFPVRQIGRVFAVA